MNYNIIKLFVVFFISLSASPMGRSQILKDTVPVDRDKKVIIVTKDNLQSKLDSIRATRKDSVEKYMKKIELGEKKIISNLNSINQPVQKKKEKARPVKTKSTIHQATKAQSNTDSTITIKEKKKTLWQKINPFYKNKQHDKENKTPSDK